MKKPGERIDELEQQLAQVTTVIIESPYAGNVKRNLLYLRACIRDCLLRSEAPFASHAMYTQPGVLDDNITEERGHGIRAGFAWRAVANRTVVYVDLGVSRGMQYGIAHAKNLDHEIEFRALGIGWEAVARKSEADRPSEGW